MNKEILNDIAVKMVASGKGILAADESTPTCTKRFNSIGVDSTDKSRNVYRDMLFTTPNLSDYISGVILFDETFNQSTVLDSSISIPRYLESVNILPGIKVDKGVRELALHNGEVVTVGLDDLDERMARYAKMGAKFAKWRAVISIAQNNPSKGCIDSNAHALARYAAICQSHNVVPIVEPEVLMDGSHSISQCYDVTARTLNEVFSHLDLQNVFLGGIVLKPSMVIHGSDAEEKASYQEVAEMTVKCLSETVPKKVPGIAFLSGGQSSLDATTHLNIMNRDFGSQLNWKLTFSYGRALQNESLNTWLGNQDNFSKAQDMLFVRAKCNGEASLGKYTSELETSSV